MPFTVVLCIILSSEKVFSVSGSKLCLQVWFSMSTVAIEFQDPGGSVFGEPGSSGTIVMGYIAITSSLATDNAWSTANLSRVAAPTT